jgi:hypothetical protein
MITIVILMVTMMVFEIIAICSKTHSLWSPFGMLIVTLCSMVAIGIMFEVDDVLGWFTVLFTLVFYICFAKSVHLYFKGNKI